MKSVNNAVFVDRVKGIIGLRVADASIIPEITDYTNAATIMVAEKAADIIKSEAKNPLPPVPWKYGMMGYKMALGEPNKFKWSTKKSENETIDWLKDKNKL